MKPTDEKSCCGPSCCTPDGAAVTAGDAVAADGVRAQVRDGYSRIAKGGVFAPSSNQNAPDATTPSTSGRGCGPEPVGGGGCCGAVALSPDDLAAALGYSQAELASMPAQANMGLSCGNPTAIASLAPGEVVLDLGAGGGFDCFIAGRKVGPDGSVIGVDMTPEMITRARRNAAQYTDRTGLSNVEFRLGEIEHLPVADQSVDVVISNCVLNLSPDKRQVWREIARVLRPGGRVAVSDLALLQPLPAAVKNDVEALVGCVAGAALVSELRDSIQAAGLVDVRLTSKPEYVAVLTNARDPLFQKIVGSLPSGMTPADFVTSLDIAARKTPADHDRRAER